MTPSFLIKEVYFPVLMFWWNGLWYSLGFLWVFLVWFQYLFIFGCIVLLNAASSPRQAGFSLAVELGLQSSRAQQLRREVLVAPQSVEPAWTRD